jgi:hypothetical protein
VCFSKPLGRFGPANRPGAWKAIFGQARLSQRPWCRNWKARSKTPKKSRIQEFPSLLNTRPSRSRQLLLLLGYLSDRDWGSGQPPMGFPNCQRHSGKETRSLELARPCFPLFPPSSSPRFVHHRQWPLRHIDDRSAKPNLPHASPPLSGRRVRSTDSSSSNNPLVDQGSTSRPASRFETHVLAACQYPCEAILPCIHIPCRSCGQSPWLIYINTGP